MKKDQPKKNPSILNVVFVDNLPPTKRAVTKQHFDFVKIKKAAEKVSYIFERNETKELNGTSA